MKQLSSMAAVSLTAVMILIAGAAMAPVTAQHANDPRYPVCVETGSFGRFGSSTPQCRFDNFTQCRLGLASNERCYANPFYQPPAKPRRRGKTG